MMTGQSPANASPVTAAAIAERLGFNLSPTALAAAEAGAASAPPMSAATADSIASLLTGARERESERRAS
jgi:hypothetical protein